MSEIMPRELYEHLIDNAFDTGNEALLLAHDAALRLALETATREAAAHWRTVESLRERLDSCEAERDEWKAHYDAILSRPAPPSCPVDHSTCSRCDRDTSDDPQVFVLCDECYAATAMRRPAPLADAATEAVRMLRHLCNVYGCTSYGRKPDHGPDDCSWCEAEALLTALSPAPAPSAKEGR